MNDAFCYVLYQVDYQLEVEIVPQNIKSRKSS